MIFISGHPRSMIDVSLVFKEQQHFHIHDRCGSLGAGVEGPGRRQPG
jgi:hypothetical protein